jgi:hypothetical protein
MGAGSPHLPLTPRPGAARKRPKKPAVTIDPHARPVGSCSVCLRAVPDDLDPLVGASSTSGSMSVAGSTNDGQERARPAAKSWLLPRLSRW